MTIHYLTAGCPFGLGEIEVEIGFNFTPGSPARGPSYSSGGEPADPPQIEFHQAIIPKLQLNAEMQNLMNAWAREYLASDDGYQIAIESMFEADDGDYRRDQARDDAMGDRP